MGVKNLWDILESCKKTLPLHHLQNKRVCVDLSCWMVQLHSVNKSHCAMKEKIYLKGLFHRIRALIALNCSLIFVTDGSIPAIKLSTYRRRLNAGGGNETVLVAGNPHKVSSLKRNKGSEFSCMIKEAKVIAMALGIPCLDGIEEAEAQCALLNSEFLCDGCFTSDSDAFLFGARTVYKDICLGEGGYVVCYEMDDIERQLGFGRNSLITLAVLLGSDYTRGVRGFGPESACKIVRSIGDAAVLQRFSSEGFSVAKEQKTSKKKSQTFENKENETEGQLSVGNEFFQVIDAFLKPKCHSADSDAVHGVLALYPFDRSQLHEACARFFDWPPQKTDDYILPKIAERNLRRFANLRSVSSKLGVQVSIADMPVKCPISGIVKTRKIQGRDLFEVSWADMDGFGTSAVPAHLVESACPEKILEFNQRKAQKQKPKRKPGPKKAERTEIDERLDKLMLDIEKESARTSTFSGTVFLQARIESKTTTGEGNNNNRRTSNSVSASRRATEVEIIDLISPAPKVHNRSIFLNSQEDLSSGNVIDLSDTDESEASSPEHARKVKELRLFMTKLRDEDGFS